MPEKQKAVALIDDDEGPIDYYEGALKDAGFHVIRLKKFKEALDYTCDPQQTPSIWVVDIMIPIGDEALELDGVPVVQSTSLGLGAGLLLYKQIKQHHPAAPVVLLTSITTPQLLDRIEAELKNGDTCEAKLDTLPSQLVSIVERRIQ